jgi:hypothetical protein
MEWKMIKLFTEHPASVGETYGQHLLQALSFALRMMLGGIACLVHAFLPFLFVKTGSRSISDLHERMVVNRSRVAHRPSTIERPVTE